jgi:hypothetical protein
MADTRLLKDYGARIRWRDASGTLQEDIIYPCATSKINARREADRIAQERDPKGGCVEVWRA